MSYCRTQIFDPADKKISSASSSRLADYTQVMRVVLVDSTCATYLVTEQQRLGIERFTALVTGHSGRITRPMLCWFQGLGRGRSGLSLAWGKWGGHGWIGRHQRRHWAMTGMMAWVGHRRWAVLRNGRDRAGSCRRSWFGSIFDRGTPEGRGPIGQVWLWGVPRLL